MGVEPDRKPQRVQRASAAQAAGALEEEASVHATTLARVAKFWRATLALAVALTVSGAAFARDGGGGGDGNGGGAPSAPAPAPGPAAPGSNGPAFSPNAASSDACAIGPTLPTLPTFQEGGDAVKALSRATESYIRNCGCATQACIADALDTYAAALAQVAPRLPPQLQDEANVVAQAARRVRAAHTKAEAQRALHDAIAIIHKDIELVKAEDPDHPRLTRGGDFVAETLNVASLALEKGGGL
jgi:hypothetical protein